MFTGDGYISLDIFLNTKSITTAPAYFSASYLVKLKFPTVIGDDYIRVKIINQRLNFNLITDWRT